MCALFWCQVEFSRETPLFPDSIPLWFHSNNYLAVPSVTGSKIWNSPSFCQCGSIFTGKITEFKVTVHQIVLRVGIGYNSSIANNDNFACKNCIHILFSRHGWWSNIAQRKFQRISINCIIVKSPKVIRCIYIELHIKQVQLPPLRQN